MRQRFLSAALFSLLAAGAAFACADGDDADDKPKNTGGAGGGGGSGGGVGGFGGVGGSSGGSGGSGGATGGTGGSTGGSGGQSGSGGSGGTGGADASLDAPSDVSLDSPAEAEAGLDAGNCVPAADAGPAPDAGCAAGQYYNPCKQSCVPCSDLSWLEFHDPVGKVAGLSGGKDALFPRVTTLTSGERAGQDETAHLLAAGGQILDRNHLAVYEQAVGNGARKVKHFSLSSLPVAAMEVHGGAGLEHVNGDLLGTQYLHHELGQSRVDLVEVQGVELLGVPHEQGQCVRCAHDAVRELEVNGPELLVPHLEAAVLLPQAVQVRGDASQAVETPLHDQPEERSDGEKEHGVSGVLPIRELSGRYPGAVGGDQREVHAA